MHIASDVNMRGRGCHRDAPPLCSKACHLDLHGKGTESALVYCTLSQMYAAAAAGADATSVTTMLLKVKPLHGRVGAHTKHPPYAPAEELTVAVMSENEKAEAESQLAGRDALMGTKHCLTWESS